MVKGAYAGLPRTYMKFLEGYEAELAKKVKKKGLVITVSGLSKSGKSTIAKKIAKAYRLRYVFAGEIFRKVAESRGIPIDEFSKIREKEIDHEMDRRTLKYAVEGKSLIDARLSGWVAGKWADVKIFVECSLEDRAKRLTQEEGMTLERAMDAIRKRDVGDSEKYRQLYNIDQKDTSIYDIIIDNSKLTLEEAKTVPVKLVREFLKKKSL
jgi:cytidylate kinase